MASCRSPSRCPQHSRSQSLVSRLPTSWCSSVDRRRRAGDHRRRLMARHRSHDRRTARRRASRSPTKRVPGWWRPTRRVVCWPAACTSRRSRWAGWSVSPFPPSGSRPSRRSRRWLTWPATCASSPRPPIPSVLMPATSRACPGRPRCAICRVRWSSMSARCVRAHRCGPCWPKPMPWCWSHPPRSALQCRPPSGCRPPAGCRPPILA